MRLTRRVSVAVATALAVTALTGPGAGRGEAGEAATPETAGTASALATGYKINPTTASLSLGFSFGVSIAGYTNNVAQAESRGIDLGIIGSTLAGEGCDGGEATLPAEDQPQPLRADSRSSGATPASEQEKYVPLITKTVQATSTPMGRAITSTAALEASGALVEVGPVTSRAVTQLVDGTREAVATVDVASVKVAGIVEIAGLKWSATKRSGADDAAKGKFSIGSLVVAGRSVPTADPTAAFETANQILARLGVQLQQPTIREAAGFVFVDPLVVRVVPNAQRDQLAALLLAGAQPMRESLVDILLEQDCGNATYVTVADIVLGSLTGAGSFGIELGGVQAKAEPLNLSRFLTGIPPITTNLGGGNLGGFDVFDSGETILRTERTDTRSSSDRNTNRRTASRSGGSRADSAADRLALVGLLGLAGLLTSAERDRRMMRRAQRIPWEA